MRPAGTHITCSALILFFKFLFYRDCLLRLPYKFFPWHATAKSNTPITVCSLQTKNNLRRQNSGKIATGSWTTKHIMHTETQLRGNLEWEINKWSGPVCPH